MSKTVYYTLLVFASLSVSMIYVSLNPISTAFHYNHLFQIFGPPDQKYQKSNSFCKTFKTFNWTLFEDAVLKNDLNEIETYTEKLIQELTYFLILEPSVPINISCKAPLLQLPEEVNCSSSKYTSGLNGNRTKSASGNKIGVLIQFGFDVDSLEIHFNELYDVVDQFFIIESTKSHFRTMPKSLMWEKVKLQSRFSKFAEKVTHFVIDDAENAFINELVNGGDNSRTDDKVWGMENLQEKLRWEKFVEWNNAHLMFSDEDILGFGDTDEIPSRKIVHVLKYCEMKKGIVDFGIWFPFGNIHQAFLTDWPVPGHKFTLGDPTYWTLKSAKSSSNTGIVPSRKRGRTGEFLLGGMHMSNYGYLPLQLVKRMTASETGYLTVEEMQLYYLRSVNDQIREFELEYAVVPLSIRNRIFNFSNVASELSEIAVLPWFYDCNRARYPVWEGDHDLRLD